MPITYENPAQPISRHKQKMNNLNPNPFTSGGSFQASTTSATTTSNPSSSSNIMEPSSKITWEETENDELMAVLGYKVKSSDMTQVAQKLQQLEQVIISNQDNLSEIVSDSIHYNPSDLSNYLESMIYEFNPSINTPSNQEPITYSSSSSVVVYDDSAFESDLTAIPGKAIYPPTSTPTSASTSPPRNKRLKTSWDSSCGTSNNIIKSTNLGRPVVMVESEENGVRLVHVLMACAEAVQMENYKLAEALVKQIGILAVSQAGSMRKVATYFADALARTIYKLYPCNQNNYGFRDYLEMHFYEACPYLKFAHFTANQAILEAFAGKSYVHVIDFGIKQGMQWPALLQALALRSGGAPSFRLTGIGPPSGDDSDYLQEVGWKLAQLADTIDIKFEYRGYVASSLADLDASMFDVREGETIAVNSIFELHPMLALPGAIDKVLSVVRGLKPCIFTVVEQEANHNGAHFLDRFTEALHYYSTLFDSVEGGGSGLGAGGDCEVGVVVGGGGGVTEQDKVMTEVYLGRQICNVLACEGIDRVERHETLAQWRTRFDSAEFEPVHLGSNAFKQASMLLALFNGDGYRVEENNGCLLLGWHTRPLISTSAWKIK